MKPKILDVIKLNDGREATVLEVYDNGKAFMVEISDSEGETIETPMIKLEDVNKIIYSS